MEGGGWGGGGGRSHVRERRDLLRLARSVPRVSRDGAGSRDGGPGSQGGGGVLAEEALVALELPPEEVVREERPPGEVPVVGAVDGGDGGEGLDLVLRVAGGGRGVEGAPPVRGAVQGVPLSGGPTPGNLWSRI